MTKKSVVIGTDMIIEIIGAGTGKMMKLLILFFFLSALPVFFISPPAMGEAKTELLPFLSLSQSYDDNIFLEKTNRQSDYITAISFGAGLNYNTGITQIGLKYSPALVIYRNHKENNTIRQSATMDLSRELVKHLKFQAKDTFIITEEPFALEETAQTVRHTRNKYYRNAVQAGLAYQLAPRDNITVGYIHSLLKNEDITLDDIIEQGPFSEVFYWFNLRNGIRFDFASTQTTYYNETGPPVNEDLLSYRTGMRYIHRFNIHSQGFLNYRLESRDFAGNTEDHLIHNWTAGTDHAFSPRTSLFLETGYFQKVNEISPSNSGFRFDGRLLEKLKHGNITLSAGTGWDEEFIGLEVRGFTRFWTLGANIGYRLLKDVSVTMGGSYRQNQPLTGADFGNFLGRTSVEWAFWRWNTLRLEYTHRSRVSDNPEDEYSDNIIMILFSLSKPYRWGLQ